MAGAEVNVALSAKGFDAAFLLNQHSTDALKWLEVLEDCRQLQPAVVRHLHETFFSLFPFSPRQLQSYVHWEIERGEHHRVQNIFQRYLPHCYDVSTWKLYLTWFKVCLPLSSSLLTNTLNLVHLERCIDRASVELCSESSRKRFQRSHSVERGHRISAESARDRRSDSSAAHRFDPKDVRAGSGSSDVGSRSAAARVPRLGVSH